MLTDDAYIRLLEYFDSTLWDYNVTETNWNYHGIILDYYFENSVLNIDYLGIDDFFTDNGGFLIDDTVLFKVQYAEISGNRRLLLIENILNILKESTFNKEQSSQIIQRVVKYLNRFQIKVVNPKSGKIQLFQNNIIGEGSYCNIIRIKDGIVKKILKQIYSSDAELKKRMKYEYENTKKLEECSHIIKVYEYDFEENSYLMEQADDNLYDYLNTQIDISDQEKLKIIFDILKGMEYAHNNDIIHRDLHLGNILKIGGDYVISDFGWSKDLSRNRSMLSSDTPRNNHKFIDPVTANNFRAMDKKSDIYSIGRIIDYLFSADDHKLKTIVEKCTCRDRALRYDSITQLINDVNLTLNSLNSEEEREANINAILNGQYNTQVHDFIMSLVETAQLSPFLVRYKLNKFGEIIEQFDTPHQQRILESILTNYSSATGYGGWNNYDIFSGIAYYLCINLKEPITKKAAREILEGCAQIRYGAARMLASLAE